jgi:hypothetical protein
MKLFMKYWEALLINQRQRGKDGLTLPFLIGSQQYLPENHILQGIEELIVDMVNTDTIETCIRYCMGTQALIFEMRKTLNKVYYPTYQDDDQKNLSFAQFHKQDLGDSIEILIPNLINQYQHILDEGYYSAESNAYDRQANWKLFSTTEDIIFINESFKLGNLT